MLLIFSSIILMSTFCNQNTEALINSNNTVLEIENGRISGALFNIIESKKFYYGYRKIPFAAPPVGDLRFESPQPVNNWTQILNTDQEPGLCIQESNASGSKQFIGSEDCLYCSVYTPKLPKSDGKDFELLPVMVYFFGGSFSSGNISKASFGPDYFMTENVIIVLTNYRLGIFGLFSTEDEFAPGNIAFKDQSFLLRWVNKNIKFFGGDKNRVTIFGQSSGAVSVSLHLQSPMSKGLFSGAIMQSGSSLCSWSLSRHVREVSFKVGSLAGVNTNSSEVLIRKLRTLEASVIFQAYSEAFLQYGLTHDGREGLPVGPIIEKDKKHAFFTSYSHKLLSSGRYNAVPTIIGFNSLEGTPPLTEQPQKWLSVNSMNYASYPPEDANIASNQTLIKIGKEIKDRFWDDNELMITVNSAQTNEFFSEDLFFRPIIETARLFHRMVNSTYLYKFTYQGELAQNTNQAGVLHGDDTNYYWERNRTASETDKKVRKRQVRLWSNFAKYRNPTIQGKSDNVIGHIEWATIGNSEIAGDAKYMEIGENLKMKTNPSCHTHFWNKIYENYGVPPFKTF